MRGAFAETGKMLSVPRRARETEQAVAAATSLDVARETLLPRRAEAPAAA